MRVKALILTGLVLIISTPAIPAEPDESAAQTEGQAQPDLELLEFLGGFETQQGEWLDPLDLEFISIFDVEQDNAKQKN